MVFMWYLRLEFFFFIWMDRTPTLNCTIIWQDEALSVLEKFLLKQQALPQSGPSVYTDVGAWPSANCSMSDIGGSGLNGSRGSSKSSDLHKLVYVITGTGHHSQSKKARLQPAVQKFLTERGYSFEDVSSDGRGGMITITINS